MNDTDPVTLKEACDIVFRGTVKPSTLKAEADRGNLPIAKIGKRWFVRIGDVRQLFDRCRAEPKGQGYISTKRANPGSSGMDHASSALAALKRTLPGRNGN